MGVLALLQEIMRTGDTTQHQKEGDTGSHS